jgi:hypothetical protein
VPETSPEHVGFEALSFGYQGEVAGRAHTQGNILMRRLAFVAGLIMVLTGRASVKADGAEIDIKVLAEGLERALKAYNDDDPKKFWAEFCSAADALKTKETFAALYTNGYKKQFGKFVKCGELMKDKSTLQGDLGVARYKAEFAENKNLEIDVNWVREDKKIRFLQILVNKPQE